VRRGDKAFYGLQARAALCGAVLETSTTDAGEPLFLGTLGSVTVRFATLASVQAWVSRLEGSEA
jgi:hypothetical protein